MMQTETWLVLIVSLPREPSSLRVRAWRRLKMLGAVALKRGVWVLPASAETVEQFQWLTQEVERDRGEGTLLRVDRVENLSYAELVRRFHDVRNADYRALAERYRRLLRTLDRARGVPQRARAHEEATRLARELTRLREIDYFDATGAAEVMRAREAVEARLAPPALPAPSGPGLGDFRGRVWVTRPRPHVDRLASAWFIRRFIDPDARFVFAPPEALPPDAVPFDVVGAELGHQGDRCTFEILLGRSGRRDPVLSAMAEIVHETDLRDGRYAREEARGLDLAIRGLLAATLDDTAMLATGLALFDGLYVTLGGTNPMKDARARGEHD